MEGLGGTKPAVELGLEWLKNHQDPEGFWADSADAFVTWFKKWDKVVDYNYDRRNGKIFIEWFKNARTNITYNCLDRHLTDGRRNKAAIIWQGEPDEDVRVFTYQMLHDEVNKFASVLKQKGVKRGDRVSLYLPMVPELAIAMLACARIGAPHTVVFGGFSADALASRIDDAQAKLVITADGGWRRGKAIDLKTAADEAVERTSTVEKMLVVKRVGDAAPASMVEGRDVWWHDLVEAQAPDCPPVPLDSEHMLYLLYTSGTTAKPKGIMHTTEGRGAAPLSKPLKSRTPSAATMILVILEIIPTRIIHGNRKIIQRKSCRGISRRRPSRSRPRPGRPR